MGSIFHRERRGRSAARHVLGLLLAGSALFLSSSQPVRAQESVPRAITIPAGTLTQVLNRLAARTGLQIVYDARLANNRTSPGIAGTMTPAEALAKVLDGTGLSYRMTGANTATVVDSSALRANAQAIRLERIDVEGEGTVGYVATRSTAATKTNTPLIEVPQSISVVTASQIRDQGAQNLSEALRYTPGVFTQPNGESAHYDEMRIRGFQPLLYLDGMQLPLNRYFATPRIETYGLERVDVLKGPSSALYGQNAPGGLVDMVSKRPTAAPLNEIQLQTGSYNRLQGAFDFSGPIDEKREFLYRLTGLARDADTMVDYTKDQRLYIAPAFTWRPNLDTSFTILAQYGEDRGTYPQHYLPAEGTLLFNPNGRIPRSRFAGEPGFDKFERDQYSVGYLFEHRFDNVWTVRQKLRYAGVDAFFQAFRSEGLQGDLRTLNRSAFTQSIDANTFTMDNQAQADFTTGPFRHMVLFGVDYLNTAGKYDVRGNFAAPTIDIFAPIYGAAVPPFAPFFSYHDKQEQIGIYLQDQIKIDRWVLTLSGRHDWTENSTLDRLAGTTVSQNDSAFTGRAGLTYLFDSGVAPYVAYATSFQPTPGVDNSGNPFKPTTGEQAEVGIKYQPPGTNALLTVAAFDIRQQNVVTYDPVTFLGTQTGEVHVQGLEVEAKGRITDNIDLIAAYALLDSEITQSSNPYQIGRDAPLTPRHQASVWSTYTFKNGALNGLQLGGGIRYVGQTYSETETPDPVLVSSYTLFDAMLRYDLGVLTPSLRGAQVIVNAINLADKYYVTYCYTFAYCSLGNGRTVLGTLSYKW